jgi:ABC-type transport system involved in cytochrome bd biosynthesis fused ATPase/permease subunit
MATTPATDNHDDIPAMDYPQHEATYRGFLTLVKLAIVNMVFVMLSLYAFIEGHNAIAGIVLLILSVVVPVGMQLMGRRTA